MSQGASAEADGKGGWNSEREPGLGVIQMKLEGSKKAGDVAEMRESCKPEE